VALRLWRASFLLIWALPRAAPARDVQLAGFAGWRFGGSGYDPISALQIDIAAAASFGGTASVTFAERTAIELYFSRAESKAQPLFLAESADLELSYLQLGVLHELDDGGVRPFLGIGLGGARLRQSGGGARTRFSAGAVVGARVFPIPNLGFRADARLLFVFDERARGSSRSPGASGFVVRAETIVQGELTIGLVVAF
jgi:hypothetical protein